MAQALLAPLSKSCKWLDWVIQVQLMPYVAEACPFGAALVEAALKALSDPEGSQYVRSAQQSCISLFPPQK